MARRRPPSAGEELAGGVLGCLSLFGFFGLLMFTVLAFAVGGPGWGIAVGIFSGFVITMQIRRNLARRRYYREEP